MLSGTGIANALGGRSGAAKRLKTEAEKGGAHMPVFLASKSLLPYVSKELADGPLKPITYHSGEGDIEGYAAEALPEICNIWLQARQDGALNPQQTDRAQAAEIVMRGLAKLGVIAPVDFRPSQCDPCFQVADYCAWAIQRKWERGDTRSYDLIKHQITYEYDLWKKGTTKYY